MLRSVHETLAKARIVSLNINCCNIERTTQQSVLILLLGLCLA